MRRCGNTCGWRRGDSDLSESWLASLEALNAGDWFMKDSVIPERLEGDRDRIGTACIGYNEWTRGLR